jgi:hypothetical protein
LSWIFESIAITESWVKTFSGFDAEEIVLEAEVVMIVILRYI